jgi:hypothetical protein
VEKNTVNKVWKKCGKEYCEKSVKNMWKTITWENCGKTVKKIVWKTMWKRIAWEKCGK